MSRVFAVVPAVAILAACMSSGLGPPGATVPHANEGQWSENEAVAASGFYASTRLGSDFAIKGFNNPGRGNGPPICSISLTGSVHNVAVDGRGYLIVPLVAKRNQVIIYKGPGMCGKARSLIRDPYGSPVDAAAMDADRLTVIANLVDNNGHTGSISLCASARGCYSNLTNPAIGQVVGVALARNGDCWADGDSANSGAALVFFKGCSGSGQQTTGFKSRTHGGLDIDSAGNLVTIESGTYSYLRVYKRCNPACTLVGGPFSLHGVVLYGHLDQKSKHFVAANSRLEQLDFYKYSPGGLTYLYSVNHDIFNLQGAAFNPRSSE